MRMSLGQTVGTSFVPVQYPGYGPITPYDITGSAAPSMPAITLADGTMITDPLNTPATASDCLLYQCGGDPTNDLARQWCSYWGQVGAFACADAQCAPVLSQLTNCPQPAIAANVPAPVLPDLPVLTPQNITQPLPDITSWTAPAPVSTPSCSLWCVINQAIDDNPLLAVLALAGASFMLWPKGSR